MFTKEETNFCKGIAIIMMLFHHLFNDFEEYAGHPVDYRPFTGERLMFLALLCKVCVAIFVFLSGYGIAAVYERKYGNRGGQTEGGELIRFSWNRYWKLMTGYWFVFVLALLCQPLGRTVVDAYGGIGGKAPVFYFLIDVMGLSYLFSTPTLNPTWWYMTLAIFVVFVTPFLVRLMKKYGAAAVTAVVMGTIYLTGVTNASTFYVFSLLLGISCQKIRFFEKLEKTAEKSRGRRIVLFIAEMILFFVLLSYRTDYNLNGIVDGLMALTLAAAVHTFLAKVPVLSQVMCYLGKHSANIFLCHTLLYSYYFLGFFFSFYYWILIVASLVVVSLLVSMAMEFIKEKTGYTKKMQKLGDKIYSSLM